MNKPTTEKARAFIAKNPTLIGRVNGVDLYEHPTKGDESQLVAITADGRLRPTDCWELPDALSREGRELTSL
jgi:hypothetical protein